ncbi:ABC transporter ATP-binding protein [Betaproteobacteria bacterium]|nr:ABC transporter ATP-binding protein [Betaproteobacteria bacterium]
MSFKDDNAASIDSSMGCVAIKFTNVTKTYRLYKNDRARFLSTFSSKIPFEKVNANNQLSFSINKGEAVAFLGRNGAGKSTALKIVTGVTHPNAGTVEVNGRVSALLELTAGFDMQLTGKENIKLRGQLWGLSNEQIEELTPGIVEFAELGSYINQPMRTYSSGMKSRLGFAFSSSIQPDILVVDEALSVGDKRFREKCLKRVREIMSSSHVTVLFVTHASAMAQEFCQRGIVINKGQSVYDGPITNAIEYYEREFC